MLNGLARGLVLVTALAVFGACERRSLADAGVVDAGSPVSLDAGHLIARFEEARPPSGLWSEIVDAGFALAFTSERSGRPQLHRLDGVGERALSVEPGAHHLQVVALRRRAAIVSRVEGPAEQLVVVELDDGGLRELTPPMERAHAAQLSTDEATVVFEASLTHASSLAVVEWTGGRPRPIAELGTTGSFQPAFTADGRVVFTNSSTGDPEIFLAGLDGGTPLQLTAFHREDFGAVPSPDGKRFAFVSNREGSDRVFVQGLDGRGVRRLMREPREDGELEADPVWMPNASAVLVTIRNKTQSRIALVEVADQRVRWSTDARGADQLPRPSPDGRFIAFVSERGGSTDIWVMRSNGRDAQRLTEHVAAEYEPRWWSPSR